MIRSMMVFIRPIMGCYIEENPATPQMPVVNLLLQKKVDFPYYIPEIVAPIFAYYPPPH